MKKVLIPALLLTLVVASCSKNDSTPEPGGTSTKLVQRIERADGEADKFTYDANGRLLSLADSSDDGTRTDTAVYKNNILTEIYHRGRTGAAAPAYSFEFNAATNRLVRINYTSNNPVNRFDSLVYSNTGILGMIYSVQIDETGKRTVTGTDEITVDANGNVASVTTKEILGDQGLTLKRKEVYTYDNKINPFTRIGSQPFWLVLWGYHFAGINNITRIETYRYPNGTPVLSEVATAKYTYDAEGDVINAESFEGTSDANLTSGGINVYKYSK